MDVLDILPPEAVTRVDALEYDFLKEHGYDIEGVIDLAEKRKKLKRALKARGEELRYRGAIDKKKWAILIWFELYKEGKKVATSTGLKLLPKNYKEVENGEG